MECVWRGVRRGCSVECVEESGRCKERVQCGRGGCSVEGDGAVWKAVRRGCSLEWYGAVWICNHSFSFPY